MYFKKNLLSKANLIIYENTQAFPNPWKWKVCITDPCLLKLPPKYLRLFFLNDYSLKKSYVLHTPCSSSLSSCSGTLGELEACLRHGMLSSGITYSSTSLSGRPLAVPCRAVDGIASSKIAPLSVVSYSRSKTHKTFLVLILQWLWKL